MKGFFGGVSVALLAVAIQAKPVERASQLSLIPSKHQLTLRAGRAWFLPSGW